MRLEWSNREAVNGRYWLELFDEDKKIGSVLLIDCKKDSLSDCQIIKYKYSGIAITDDISLGEAMEQVEDYYLGWWKKQLARAERDYDEAFRIVEFLQEELND